MAQSLTQIYIHTVFSTKYRVPTLRDRALRSRLHAYLAGICKKRKCNALHIGGWEDHVHILHQLGKEEAISHLLMVLKKESSKWMKKEAQGCPEFAWQGGYGSFSISPAHVEAVRAYVDSDHQEEHHRSVSFQDEFRMLCRKYSVDIDERYVWD